MSTTSKHNAVRLAKMYQQAMRRVSGSKIPPSGVSTRLQRRAAREHHRRVMALVRRTESEQRVPREQRELNKLLSRSTKEQQRHYLTMSVESEEDCSDLVSQSGLAGPVGYAAGAAAAVGAAVVGYNINKTVKDVGKTVDYLNKTADAIGSTISQPVDFISGVISKLREAITALRDNFGDWWLVPAGLLVLGLYFKYQSLTALTMCLISFGQTLFGEMWAYVARFFTGEQVEAQSGALDIATFVATIASCLFVPKRDPATMVGEVMRRIGGIERTQSGLSYVFERGLAYFEKFVNAILSLFNKEHVEWTSQTDRMITEWAGKVDAFELLSTTKNPSLEELNGAMKLLQEGIGFRQLVKTTYNQTFLGRYIDRLTGSIQAHRGALDRAAAFRMQPICIMLGGGSGVGKTTVIKWLASAAMLLTKAVPANEIMSNMWQKGLSEFWNGYVQQFAYIMDDCFQQKTDGKQLDNEAMFLIRAVGNWAFPLNFADLDSKGRFYFQSKLIIGSTNEPNIRSAIDHMVAAPDAVTRRIEHGYWVFVHPDFQQGAAAGSKANMLDYAKVARYITEKREALTGDLTVEALLDCIPWHAWQMVPHGFTGTAPTLIEHSETLLDLAKRVAAQYEQRSAAHASEVAELEKWSADMSSCVIAQGGLGAEARYADADDEFEDAASVGPIDDEDPHFGGGIPTLEYRKPYTACFDTDHEDKALLEHMSDDARQKFVSDQERKWLKPPVPSPEPRQGMTGKKLWFWTWRAERVAAFKRREDWMAEAYDSLIGWMAGKGFPKWMQGIVRFMSGEHVSFVTPSQARVAEALGADPAQMGVGATHTTALMQKTVWRIATAGIVGMLCSTLFGIAMAVLKMIVDFVSRLFGAVPESNVRSSLPTKGDIKLPRIVSQLGNPPADIQGELAFNNTYKLFAEGEERSMIGQVLFIEGDLAVMPSHFRKHLAAMNDPMLPLRFVSCHNSQFNVRIEARDFLKCTGLVVPGTDIEFVRFDKRMLKTHRSLTHLFLQESALKQFFRNKGNNVRLDIARMRNDKSYEIVRHTFVSNTCEYLEQAMPVADVGLIQGLAVYSAPTCVGDCGAPLSICEPRFFGGSSLLGIHVAGKACLMDRKGYANVITREMVVAARSELGTWADNFSRDMLDRGITVTDMTAEEEALLKQCGLLGGSFLPIGKVDKPLHMGKVSKIKSSPIQEAQLWGPAPNAPAPLAPVLRDGAKVEPMARAMDAYQAPLEFKHYADLDTITDMAMSKHWSATMQHGRQILTFEEAVSPPESMKMKPIQRTTSPGYPYRLSGDAGKKAFFGAEGDFTFDSEECEALRQDVDNIIAQASLNTRSSVIFTDFLKDELRSHAKVEAVASRAISGAPLDYTIAVRMYFGSFMAAMFATPVVSGMAPGINPYKDWHLLAESLLSKGGKVFGGDFKRFDAGQQPYLLEAILRYINRWYAFNNPHHKPEHDLIRTVLWLDLTHSRHLTGVGGKLDTVVQWNKSLPSGHPLTTPVNSMFSLITLAACYAAATGDKRNMWLHVYICTYGDDNVNAPSDAVADVFNQVTVSKLMKELFGLTYTSDKKDAELVPYESIEQLTFLKRTFAVDEEASGGWAAPLDPDSFLYTPYWFKNPRDVKGDLFRNVEQMQGELCLHSPAMWDKYQARLEEFSATENFELPFRTRESAREWVLNRADAWY